MPRTGRHELGQNFLTDPATITRVVELVRQRPGDIVEWGTGDGALTLPLAALGRPLQGIEVDGRRARALDRRTGPHVCIGEGDILRHAPPAGSVVVSNIPFHLTTPILRHLLATPGWQAAVLLTQWEVARKRAGVGGATQLTAQWWPWFDFRLDRRVPAAAFRPRPSVDAGLLVIDRRTDPLLPIRQCDRYQSWVARVFGSRGRGIQDILVRNGVPVPTVTRIARRRTGRRGLVLPRDLRPEDWAEAYRQLTGPTDRSARRRRGPNIGS